MKIDSEIMQLVDKAVHPKELYRIDWVSKAELNAMPPHVKNQYEYDPQRRCYFLPEYEWVNWREHGPYYDKPRSKEYIKWTIGGSAIATLFDGSHLQELLEYPDKVGSHYDDILSFWAKKADIDLPIAPPQKKNNVFFVGHVEEESIRQTFKRMYLKDHPMDIINVENDTMMYQCGEKDEDGKLIHPYILCNLDGTVTINGIKGGLECKTCNFGSKDYNLWMKDVVPLHHFLQVQWYMKGVNLPYFYVVVKTGIYEESYKYFYVERNNDVIRLLCEAAEKFINCCEKKIEPELPTLDDTNVSAIYAYYVRKFGTLAQADTQPEELPEECRKELEELAMIDADYKALLKHAEELKKLREKKMIESIFKVAKNPFAKFYYLNNGDTITTFKFRANPRGVPFDEDRFRDENPELYKKYLVAQKPKLSMKELKKEQSELVAKYETKPSLTDALTKSLSIDVKDASIVSKKEEKTA